MTRFDNCIALGRGSVSYEGRARRCDRLPTVVEGLIRCCIENYSLEYRSATLHLGDVVRIARNRFVREEAEAAVARLVAQEAEVDIQKVVGPESVLYLNP
jgi:hypothetical protein